MTLKVKISVALCTCNGEAYIEQQLTSILNQTYLPDEIIVVDDASEDKTIILTQQILENSNITYSIHVNENRLGAAANFLKAMKLATGDYIFCCDQDDIWKEDKLACFMQRIQQSHKQLYFSNGLLVNAAGVSMKCTVWESLHFHPSMLDKTLAFDLILNRCFVTGAAMAVSKELVDTVEEIPEGWLHDGWFSLLACVNHSIEAIDEILFYYRQHAKNVVGAGGRNLVSNVRRWKNNTQRLKKMRTDRYQRYINIKKKGIVDNNPALDQCIQFWRELETLQTASKMKGIIIVQKNILNGNYKKYYTGFKGGFRDVLSLFS